MMFKNYILTLLLVLCALCVSAQIPTHYYDNARDKHGHELQVALFTIIKPHTAVSYDALWTHFYTTDAKPNGKVWDIYSDIPDGTPHYEYTFGSDQCGNYSKEGDCYNREHSMPKSWFNDLSPMYTDMFHLYPTDGWVNGKRSNDPYGKVGSASWTSTNGSKLGSCATPGYSGTVFEPIDAYKGDLARTYFYMTTCYMDKTLSAAEGSNMMVGSQLKPWALEMLIQWHQNDPVSQKEIDRNNHIYDIQHNRNPYIDYPELVGLIFGSDSVNYFLPTTIHSVTNDKPIIYPNPVSNELLISNLAISKTQITIFDLQGRIFFTQTVTGNECKIDVTTFPSGLYFVKIDNSVSKIVKIDY